MAIQKLNQGSFSSSSQIPFNDPQNGVDRRASVADLAAAIGALLATDAGDFVTQYTAPNASAFNVLIAPVVAGSNMWLLMTPLAGFAAGTITLPAVSTCVNGQELLVNSTQAVTALTVAGNGASVNGAPTTLAANAFFRLRFDVVLASWYRVG